ncbi:MAG: SDR family oxidoreductase [Alphaproteobacteria bacterium]|nr:SDR family oxidoreductase [Alphaproteobacteria bacterium]
MGRFDGKVAWITGGGTGIGLALALEFARQGAAVAISGRRAEKLQEGMQQLEALGAKALAVPCDVTDEPQVEAAVATVVRELGALDVVVANAGFSVNGKVEDLSFEDWRRQFDVNVFGLAVTAKHAAPELRKTQGRIALIGSGAAFTPMPGASPYCASKAAVHSIGVALWAELKKDGVSVITIHPGFIESEIARVDNEGVHHPEREDRRPAQLMWKAEPAAKVMVKGIYARRREMTVTGHAALGVWLGRHFSWLVAWAVGR